MTLSISVQLATDCKHHQMDTNDFATAAFKTPQIPGVIVAERVVL